MVLRRRGLEVRAARQGEGVTLHLDECSRGSAWSIDRGGCGIRRILGCNELAGVVLKADEKDARRPNVGGEFSQ